MSNKTIHGFDNCLPIRVTMLSEKWGLQKSNYWRPLPATPSPKSESKLYIKNWFVLDLKTICQK